MATRAFAATKTAPKWSVPFLELDQELWDRENQRVTLLLDPGRIKRGLASLAEEGPALEEGARYTLVVDRDWPDAHGTPLAEEFRKPFRVTEADRKPPQVTDWRIMPPRAGVQRCADRRVSQAPRLRFAAAHDRSEERRRSGRGQRPGRAR